MKTHLNLMLLLFIAVSISFTSCKKEPGCMDPNAFNYNPDAQIDDESCIDKVIGCMDTLAMNYDASVNIDDESCEYAYDLAQGLWEINPDCEDIDILGQSISLNDQLPESIDVQGMSDNMLFIDIDGTQISGEIDSEGNVTIPVQTVSIDPLGMGSPIDVDIEGDGKIESENSGYMDLTYSGEISIPNIPFPLPPFSTNCHITLTK